MEVFYAAGLLHEHLFIFLKIEITELRDLITHVALEKSTINLSIFYYRE